MLRLLSLIYHLGIAFSAVALLIALVIGVGYLLLEGLLGYFFGIDLLDWIKESTGLDLGNWFGGEASELEEGTGSKLPGDAET